MNPYSRVIVIAGPTGVGESTITRAVIDALPNAERLITTTTRPVRVGEREGESYHFLSREEFERRLAAGRFLEHIYMEERGVYYGTDRAEVERILALGHICIANLELKGWLVFQKEFPGATSIFIVPENLEQIRARKLQQHPDITPTELDHRLAEAQEEITHAALYNHVVVNREGAVDAAIQEVILIIRNAVGGGSAETH